MHFFAAASALPESSLSMQSKVGRNAEVLHIGQKNYRPTYSYTCNWSCSEAKAADAVSKMPVKVREGNREQWIEMTTLHLHFPVFYFLPEFCLVDEACLKEVSPALFFSVLAAEVPHAGAPIVPLYNRGLYICT